MQSQASFNVLLVNHLNDISGNPFRFAERQAGAAGRLATPPGAGAYFFRLFFLISNLPHVARNYFVRRNYFTPSFSPVKTDLNLVKHRQL